MSRTRGSFTDLLEISAKLPWQVSVSLAVVSGVGLHFLAARFSVAPRVTELGQMGSVVVQQSIHTIAIFLQFIVPAGFLIGATASALIRLRSGKLIEITRANPAKSLSSMRWRDLRGW